MAPEKVTLGVQNSVNNTDTVKTGNSNNFNSLTLNPFVKEVDALNKKAASSTGFLFNTNNEVVDEEPLFSATGEKKAPAKNLQPSVSYYTRELEQNTTNSIAEKPKWGIFGTFSNYLKNIGSQVNEYDASINNALKYLPNEGELSVIVDSNPRIHAILGEHGLPVKLNYDNLKTIKHKHLAKTVEYASEIGKVLGLSNQELLEIEVGAALHDIGKSLIPSEILNKQGRLTDEERSVINLHSVLGYEILKSYGLKTNVCEIARDHHNPNSTNKLAQIVRAADIYSAMREKRSYKPVKSHEQAMDVLKQNNIAPEMLAALGTKTAAVQPSTVSAHTPVLCA